MDHSKMKIPILKYSSEGVAALVKGYNQDYSDPFYFAQKDPDP